MGGNIIIGIFENNSHVTVTQTSVYIGSTVPEVDIKGRDK